MTSLLTVLHVIVCLFLMLTVLLQPGQGGGMGGAFGGGNTATVFGGSGASTFLRKLTAGAVVVFMLDSMVLAWLATHHGRDTLDSWAEQQEQLRKEKQQARSAAEHIGSNGGSNAIVAPGSAAHGLVAPGSAVAPAPMVAPAPATTGSAAAPAATDSAAPHAAPAAPAPAAPAGSAK